MIRIVRGMYIRVTEYKAGRASYMQAVAQVSTLDQVWGGFMGTLESAFALLRGFYLPKP